MHVIEEARCHRTAFNIQSDFAPIIIVNGKKMMRNQAVMWLLNHYLLTNIGGSIPEQTHLNFIVKTKKCFSFRRKREREYIVE